MDEFKTNRYTPLFFDLLDGLPTSIDTGKPVYKCSCCSITREPFFKATGAYCDLCEAVPKRVYADLSTGELVLININTA